MKYEIWNMKKWRQLHFAPPYAQQRMTTFDQVYHTLPYVFVDFLVRDSEVDSLSCCVLQAAALRPTGASPIHHQAPKHALKMLKA